jgi:serine/threonine protein kinase
MVSPMATENQRSLHALERTQDLHGQAAPPNASVEFATGPSTPPPFTRLETFEIVEEIGRGGMGVVYLAIDSTLERPVAIKVLHPDLRTRADARKRFLREVRAAAQVKHDNIVTIHSVGIHEDTPYAVMEYVPGSLADRLGSLEPMPLDTLVDLGKQIACGLAAAHARGLVHRDIKPSNILLEPRPESLPAEAGPRAKIADFGIACRTDDPSPRRPRRPTGTPLYMSPESIAGRPLDQRSDLYSFGVLLFVMATGRPPFVEEFTCDLLDRHLETSPPEPTALAPGCVPPWLEQLILGLMNKDPAARPQSAAAVVHFLEEHSGLLRSPFEEDRLEKLRSYRVLDTPAEQPFDEVSYLAAQAAQSPMASISLIDANRQWYKSALGLERVQTPRNLSFCAHTIQQRDPLVVPDALEDPRFSWNPLVRSGPRLRFYAGVPLLTREGYGLGALCVMDRKPRRLTASQLAALVALGRVTMEMLEARRDRLAGEASNGAESNAAG